MEEECILGREKMGSGTGRSEKRELDLLESTLVIKNIKGFSCLVVEFLLVGLWLLEGTLSVQMTKKKSLKYAFI